MFRGTVGGSGWTAMTMMQPSDLLPLPPATLTAVTHILCSPSVAGYVTEKPELGLLPGYLEAMSGRATVVVVGVSDVPSIDARMVSGPFVSGSSAQPLSVILVEFVARAAS